MSVDDIFKIDHEALSRAEAELKQNSEFVIAVTLDGTKGYSQGFVLGLISVLSGHGIKACYRYSSGSLGLESSGPIFTVLVHPGDMQSAQPIIAEELAK